MLMNNLFFLSFLIFCISCGEIKKVSTKGTSFGHNGGPNDCIIDSTEVSCTEMENAFKIYKESIHKCNPCWLTQYDYSGNKLKEGYAVRSGLFTHHHKWIREYYEYSANGDTIQYYIDSNVNINRLRFLPVFITRSAMTIRDIKNALIKQ